MTIEKFLSFWSHHNTEIIEGLIALIVLIALFLAYRSFFGKKSAGAEEHASGGTVNVDAAQLEKTLQKLIENQSLGAKLSANSDELSVGHDVDLEASEPEAARATGEPAASAAGGGEATSAEVAQLRASLSESTKKMEILRTQLVQAQEQVTAAKNEAAAAANAPAAAGGAAPAAGGMSAEERSEFDAKVKDLEARLAEYEIISEDIADLSRYREENDALKKQLESLKATAPSTPPPAAAAPAAPAVDMGLAIEPLEQVKAAPAAPAPEATPAPPKLAAVPDASPAVETPAESPAEETSSLIDDDLMKEFAAAVEGQKSALETAAEKASDGTTKPKTDDTDKLMDQFEDFVGNKKS